MGHESETILRADACGESCPGERADRYALIGAGPVGLGIARALVAHGIAYEQIEADDDVGGNWYHGVYATARLDGRWEVEIAKPESGKGQRRGAEGAESRRDENRRGQRRGAEGRGEENQRTNSGTDHGTNDGTDHGTDHGTNRGADAPRYRMNINLEGY